MGTETTISPFHFSFAAPTRPAEVRQRGKSDEGGSPRVSAPLRLCVNWLPDQSGLIPTNPDHKIKGPLPAAPNPSTYIHLKSATPRLAAS
jgi:hypothetical protein